MTFLDMLFITGGNSLSSEAPNTVGCESLLNEAEIHIRYPTEPPVETGGPQISELNRKLQPNHRITIWINNQEQDDACACY